MTKNPSFNFSFFRRDDGSQMDDPEIEDMFERGTRIINSTRRGDLIEQPHRWHNPELQRLSDRWDRMTKQEMDAEIERQTYNEASAKWLEEASKCKE